MTTHTESAAKRFFAAIAPDIPWQYTDHKAKPLVLAAFALYAKSWNGFDIREWKWPFNQIRDGETFDGDEPWTVLLRRAVDITKASAEKAAQASRSAPSPGGAVPDARRRKTMAYTPSLSTCPACGDKRTTLETKGVGEGYDDCVFLAHRGSCICGIKTKWCEEQQEVHSIWNATCLKAEGKN